MVNLIRTVHSAVNPTIVTYCNTINNFRSFFVTDRCEQAEDRLIATSRTRSPMHRLAPVFSDRDHTIRSASLAGTDQVCAVAVNREDEMLARVKGAF